MRPLSSAMLFLFVALAVPMSERSAFAGPPEMRYVFVEDTDRWVRVIRGEWELIGKLDKNGDFIPEFKVKKGQRANLNPGYPVLNSSALARQKVYELRSGMLIPGEIRPDGRFVPQAGGKVIPFEDYEYSKKAPSIWNLPGLFLPEDKAARLKRSKSADKK